MIKSKNNSFYNKFSRDMASLFASIFLTTYSMGLTGLCKHLYAEENLLNTSKARFVCIKNNKTVFSADIGDGYPELFIADKDGSNQTRLTFTPNLGEVNAKWISDEEIVYIAGNVEIFKIINHEPESDYFEQGRFFKIRVDTREKDEIRREEYHNLIKSKNETKKTGGILVIFSEPDEADIYLNGELVGKTPMRLENFSVGEYNFLLRKNSWIDWTGTVTVSPNRAALVEKKLENTLLFHWKDFRLEPGHERKEDFEIIDKGGQKHKATVLVRCVTESFLWASGSHPIWTLKVDDEIKSFDTKGYGGWGCWQTLEIYPFKLILYYGDVALYRIDYGKKFGRDEDWKLK